MALDIELYTDFGSFIFNANESLSLVCNAPKDANGVYLVYDVTDIRDELIYIGTSGKMSKDGNLITRKDGGLYARLVKGTQFLKPRNKSWPIKMSEDKIESIRVNWYVTFNDVVKHIPTFVEGCLIQDFFREYGRLPQWKEKY